MTTVQVSTNRFIFLGGESFPKGENGGKNKAGSWGKIEIKRGGKEGWSCGVKWAKMILTKLEVLYLLGGGNSNIFFTPDLGEKNPIFQMDGFNHQACCFS